MWERLHPFTLVAIVCATSSVSAAPPDEAGRDSSVSAEATTAAAASGPAAPSKAEATGTSAAKGNAKPKAQAATKRDAGSGEVRRDPSGVKGMSPYTEALVAGDAAYVKKDYQNAVERFKRAIELEPKNPVAHARLGRALLSSNDAEGAEKSWLEASRLASKELKLKARVLWMLADLRERQGQPSEAIAAYRVYKGFTTEHPDAAGFPKSADSRIERIEQYQEMVQECGAVKERIRQRAEEGEERLRKSSK